MHASAETLARLAPKISCLTSLGSGFGELKPLDLAGALAGLPAGPYALARVAWVDDRAGWQALIEHVGAALVAARYPMTGHPQGAPLRGVIALAAAEYCWPPGCQTCAGRGKIKKQDYYGECMACNGSGYGRVPLASLADNCGVSGEEWRRVWSARYERVYRLCSGWGSEVLSHLHRRLSEED